VLSGDELYSKKKKKNKKQTNKINLFCSLNELILFVCFLFVFFFLNTVHHQKALSRLVMRAKGGNLGSKAKKRRG